MPSRGKALVIATALGAAVALLFLSTPLLVRQFPPVLVFVGAALLGLPLLIAAQRSWTRFLWARRIDKVRQKAETAAADDPEPHVELGVLLSLAGTDGEAKAAFERARAIHPRHAQATVGLAHLAAENGDLDAALSLFSEAAESDPQLFAAHYGIGGVQFQREQFARAVHAYERALAIEPDDAFTLASLSRCHLLLGDPDKAEEYFIRAAGRGLRDSELEKMIKASMSDEA